MVVDEPLARHLIEVVIAPSHATATNVEFAHHAHWQFVAIAVDDKLPDIELRLAHGHSVGAGELLVVACHRNLGGTVAVEDARLGYSTQLT